MFPVILIPAFISIINFNLIDESIKSLVWSKHQIEKWNKSLEYGIVTGYADGTFRPDALITREQAMAMYQRAMKITKLSGSDTNRYQQYADFDEVSSWAQNCVQEVLATHVFNGTSATSLSPKANLTYAEAAQAIKNLLVKSKLINE